MKWVIVGSGNVASHFAKSLYRAGHQISQVISRHEANAQRLASCFQGTEASEDLTDLKNDVDVVLIAVNDDAIPEVVKQIRADSRSTILHTSGATPLHILDSFSYSGVIYPPQSIKKDTFLDFKKLPLGIEANNKEVEQMLFSVFSELSSHLFHCNSQQRLALHISSVFVNNFSNTLYQIASDILKENELSFDLLKPIVLKTAEMIQDHAPSEVQTGPAVRNDTKTISTHLEFLKENTQWREIYQLLTDEIIKQSQKQ